MNWYSVIDFLMQRLVDAEFIFSPLFYRKGSTRSTERYTHMHTYVKYVLPYRPNNAIIRMTSINYFISVKLIFSP